MKPFKTSVPIINEMITAENRPHLLDMLKRGKVERVFLCFLGVYACDIAALHENIDYFHDNGIEVGLWVGHTLGHVGDEFAFDEKDMDFQPIVRRDGKPFKNTFCPYDEKFRVSIGDKLVEILRDAYVKFVMFDDDCTLSQKGFGCTCEKHLHKMYELLGEEIPRDELAKKAFSGGENRYRTAWMQAQADSITTFAESIRKRVDEVRPDISLSICTVTAHWSFDGLDNFSLCKMLAGENLPFNRLHGAPYWANGGETAMAFPFETARMFSAFYREKGIEVFAEGDVYPRPRTNCSASRLELYDAVIHADGGYDGILKYMVSYTHHPYQEQGYIDRHVRDLPAFEKVREFFDGGANVGVNIRVASNLAWKVDMDDDIEMFNPTDLNAFPRCMGLTSPDAGNLISQSGVPTVYNKNSLCDGIFGENARHFDIDTVEKGAILDAKAAKIYTQNGADVGIAEIGEMKDVRIFAVREPQFIDGDHLIQNNSAVTLVMNAKLKAGCKPVLIGRALDRDVILGYTYENASGKKFLVFLMDGFRLNIRNSPICGCYAMQRVMKREIPWLSGKALPVLVGDTPNLYMMVRETVDCMSILLCNSSEDLIMEPKYLLSDEFKSAECVNCNVKLNGRQLEFVGDIPAFGFVTVKLKK